MIAVTTQAIAEEEKGKIGIGSYVLTVNEERAATTVSYVWSGTAIIGGYDITDNITANGSYYSLTEDIDSNSTMKGFDASVRFGPNGLGFTYYGGLGLYSETWNHSLGNVSGSYSGGLMEAGFGYNWKDVNLNWNVISFRTAKDYKGTSPNSFSAGTGAISIAYRF